MSQSDDPAMAEWLKLFGLTSELLTTSDALVACLDGRLNKEVGIDREAGHAEIWKRINAYKDAHNAVIRYARKIEAVMA